MDGLATAGGCEIVLAADLVVATTRSAFGLAEAKRNLVAGAGGLFRLPRAIGQAAAMEAILTGEPIPAERAFALGLVSRLVEPGEALAEARRLADQITQCAPLAVYESRKVVRAAAFEDDDTLKKMTDEAMGAVMALRGPQGRPDRLHRKARPAVAGPLRPPRIPSRPSEGGRHGDQAGGDAGPLVEVLGVPIARERLTFEDPSAGGASGVEGGGQQRVAEPELARLGLDVDLLDARHRFGQVDDEESDHDRVQASQLSSATNTPPCARRSGQSDPTSRCSSSQRRPPPCVDQRGPRRGLQFDQLCDVVADSRADVGVDHPIS